MDSMRKMYHALIPYEMRFWLYKARNPEEIRTLRKKVHPSPRGDFSLRAFDRYCCLFIHITKSAGTSVAKSLFGELPYHYTAVQYRVIFGRKDFNSYFKFAFVRNPWDRLYSAYSYLAAGGWDDKDRQWYKKNISHLPDFNSFVLDWLDARRLYSHLHLKPQSHFICDPRGRPMLDYLGYFETLPDDFAHISKVLGIEATLDHVNASRRSDYRNIYSPEAIDKVRALYRQDIEKLGYGFEGLEKRMKIRNRRFVAQ
ncbi:hypothetical protein HNR65_003366 [Desulfosalsimonas propionicica]|uniref:Sulfotransferase family protein n=1 Tax=Desulfosalsimonas propionicica TaxID=332175 RepID=A0A7W0HM42_9BACT|nr:sulfotransferase family 2 domain-containing protein [Desulfosalsimonas propionicica]MBA2883009.1 hypothetical protein [Desulfosalsimonas propionicica]